MEVLFARHAQDREVFTHTWVLLDLLYYLLHLTMKCPHDLSEVIALAGVDIALYLLRDDRGKLKVFHNFPKVFMLSLQSSWILTLLTAILLGLHLFQTQIRQKSVFFFFGICLGIFLASRGISKIISLSLITSVMAGYMFFCDELEPVVEKKEEDPIKLEKMNQNDEMHMKDHAIAQDLVTKIRKLKASMQREEEMAMLPAASAEDKILQSSKKRARSDSKYSRENSERGNNKEREPEHIHIQDILSLEDVRQLIEILVSHNSQEMKYWLPRDILSVLNNEEVSAYLWAYLSTQDMIPSPRAIKNVISSHKPDASIPQMGPSIGEDFNFDLFAFDKNNIYQNSLVTGCNQIYKKFK